MRCRAWAAQVKELRGSVGIACEWKRLRALAVRLLSQDERATPAVLTFLRETEIGNMVTLESPEEEGDWEKLEEIAEIASLPLNMYRLNAMLNR